MGAKRESLPLTAWVALALGLVVFALVLAAPTLIDAPLERDEGAYAVVAQQWLRGAVPYRDTFDHKPPLVYVVYALSFALGGEHLRAVRAAFAIANALTAWACGAVVWRLSGRRALAPVLVASFAACFFLKSPQLEGETANTEALMVLGTACSACLLMGATTSNRRLSVLGAGIGAGLAVMAKPVALADALFFAAWLTAHRQRARLEALALFAAGVATPLLAWAVYAFAQGALASSIDAGVLYNLHYAAGGYVPLWARLAAIPIEHGVALALLWAGVAGCLLTALRVDPLASNFALGWTAVALLAVLSPGRIYYHYYQQLVPPTAVALGITAAAIDRVVARRRIRLACIAGAMAALATPVSTAWHFAHELPAATCSSYLPRLAALLRENTDPADTLFVWGNEPFLYLAAQRQPFSRFIYKYPLLQQTEIGAANRQQLLDDWSRRHPAALIVPKFDSNPEAPRSSEEEIADPQSPFHVLTAGLAPVLDTTTFTVYARPDRADRPWREGWQRLRDADCAAVPSGATS